MTTVDKERVWEVLKIFVQERLRGKYMVIPSSLIEEAKAIVEAFVNAMGETK